MVLVGDSQMRHMKAAIDTLQCNHSDPSAEKSELLPALKAGDACPNGRPALFGPVVYKDFAGHTIQDLRMVQGMGCRFFDMSDDGAGAGAGPNTPDIIVLNSGQHPLSRNPMRFYQALLRALASALGECRRDNPSLRVVWRETSVVYKTDSHNNFNEADRVRLANRMARHQLGEVADAVLPVEAISDALPEGMRYDRIHFTEPMDAQIVNILWTNLAGSSSS
jgi:hypothetical protein